MTSAAEPPPSAPSDTSGDAAGDPPGSGRRRGRSGGGSFLRELPVLVVIAVGLALLIKSFFVQAFFIPSGSMEQTLHIGDRVLVNKLVYHTRSIHRGEIVVFDTAGTAFADSPDTVGSAPRGAVGRVVNDVDCFLGFGCAGQTDFIKRVIGLPGDRITCCNARGQVVVNGVGLVEPYVYHNNFAPICAGPTPTGPPSAQCSASSPPVVVGKGMLFVMGDHRDDSDDSRVFGQLPEKKVIGRAFLRIWPIGRIGFLRAPSYGVRAAASPAGAAAGGVLALPLVLPLVARRRRARATPRGRGRR
jgi:signal peptidase I